MKIVCRSRNRGWVTCHERPSSVSLVPRYCHGPTIILQPSHKSAIGLPGASTDSFEVLEFLGDSVLNFVVGKYLFDAHKNTNEGFLTQMRTKLVSGKTLTTIAQQLGLQHLVITESIQLAIQHQPAHPRRCPRSTHCCHVPRPRPRGSKDVHRQHVECVRDTGHVTEPKFQRSAQAIRTRPWCAPSRILQYTSRHRWI